jgi:hypothetical protein
MDGINLGLRCQDIHSGVRNVDPNSPLLSPLNDTRIIGMAATIAGLVRGRDVIPDGQALMTVAAAQLDVNMLSFDSVIQVLEEVGFVEGVQRTGGKITSFTENVPYYESLYDRLGESWTDRQPTEIEQQLISVVDGLSGSPVAVDEIESRYGLDRKDLKHVMEVGKGSGLIQVLRTVDGDIAYSPFFGFENPDVLTELANDHGSGQLGEEFEAIRNHQGLAISKEKYPLTTDAIARGLVMAPSVQLPSGLTQAFAALPYVPDRKLLTTHKTVLDKALTVLACLRCAEYDGGYNDLSQSALVSVINKLLDKNRGFLSPHSSHERQYNLMYRAGLIVFDPDPKPGGNWKMPRFVDTEDNREALILARDLITHGEGVQTRVSDHEARSALDAGNAYVAPMQTMFRNRESATQDSKHYAQLFNAAMGRGV